MPIPHKHTTESVVHKLSQGNSVYSTSGHEVPIHNWGHCHSPRRSKVRTQMLCRKSKSRTYQMTLHYVVAWPISGKKRTSDWEPFSKRSKGVYGCTRRPRSLAGRRMNGSGQRSSAFAPQRRWAQDIHRFVLEPRRPQIGQQNSDG